MFALKNHPRFRQKHLKSSGKRRHLQEVRAVYSTQLRFEPLEERRLLSLATWTGSLANDLWSNADNWGGVALAAGNDLLFPAGPTQTASVNDFTAGTAFGSIQILGDNYSLSGNQVVLGGDILSQGADNSLSLGLQLSADHNIANTAGSDLTVFSAIDLNGHNLSVGNTNASGVTELDGPISGAGGLNFDGNG